MTEVAEAITSAAYKVFPDFLSQRDIDLIKSHVLKTMRSEEKSKEAIANPLVADQALEARPGYWESAKVLDIETDDDVLYADHRKCQITNLENVIPRNEAIRIEDNLQRIIEDHWDDIAFDGEMSDQRPGISVIVYVPGDRFKWHHDLPPEPHIHDSIRGRRISFSLIVQNCEEGGDLMIKGEPDLMLKEGELVLFDSRLFHQVEEIKKGTRISLVGWWYRDEQEIVQIDEPMIDELYEV